MDFSRRDFIVGAGAGAAVGLPGVADAAVRRVGIAPEARQAIGVIGTILQDGPNLTGFGWLTQVAGLTDRDLFTDPAQRGPATARLRWHAEVQGGDDRSPPSLFYGTGKGRLRIFFDANGGAQPDRPETFATGRLVVRYTGEFRNIQTVYAPDHAITEIIGELTQRLARRFVVRGRHVQLGRVGQLSRLGGQRPRDAHGADHPALGPLRGGRDHHPALSAELYRLSERLLAAAAPLRVALAATDAEREVAYRLRYEQVVAQRWAPREALAPGAESDADDADAPHVLAWDGDAAAGTLRLVLPTAGRRLPVEAAFDLDVEPRSAVVEAGRLVVAPAFRGDPAHRIWGALLARGWLSLRERGFSVLAGTASARHGRHAAVGGPPVRDPGAGATVLGRGPPSGAARPGARPARLVLAPAAAQEDPEPADARPRTRRDDRQVGAAVAVDVRAQQVVDFAGHDEPRPRGPRQRAGAVSPRHPDDVTPRRGGEVQVAVVVEVGRGQPPDRGPAEPRRRRSEPALAVADPDAQEAGVRMGEVEHGRPR